MLNQFSRTELLLGHDAMEKLAGCRVAVFGIGGVGGYAVEALARSGVGALDLIDDDRVCLTNINRQLLALRTTVGQYKVDVAAERVHAINPNCTVTTHKCFYLPETKDQFDFTQYDYVVDAIDTLSPKAGLIRSCLERDIPVVSSMGAGAKTDPTRIRIEDIARSHHCPLAHMLRKRLHKMGIRTGFYVVFSDEPVREGSMMLCEETNKKSNVGTISYMPAVFGCHCASVVIRGLIGEMPPAAFAAETRDNVRHG